MAVTPCPDEYFDHLETISASEREDYQNRRLASHIERVYRLAPAVKKLFDGAGLQPSDVTTIQDLEKLPITRKPDLIEMQKASLPYGGVSAIPVEDVERVFVSPGPIYEIQPPDVKWFARTYWAAGFRKGDVVINTFTYHLSPAGILFHEGLRHCGATVVVAGTGNTDLQIQVMRDLKVTGFVGTPSYLMTVLKRIDDMNLDLKKDFCIRKAWFTGEMLAPSLRVTFQNDYDIDTYQAYAVTEPGGCIAYECREKNGMHLMEEYVTEIVDPDTGKQVGPGEIGELVTTQLQNPDWGLLRFGTGDLTSYTDESCPCGRTSRRMTAIAGRAGDAVKVRGMFIVAKQAEQAIKASGDISRYQLIVGREKHRDTLVLRLEAGKGVSIDPALLDNIGQAFQDSCRIKIDRIEFTESIPEEEQGINDMRKWE